MSLIGVCRPGLQECARTSVAAQQPPSQRRGGTFVEAHDLDRLLRHAVVLASEVLETEFTKVLEYLPDERSLTAGDDGHVAVVLSVLRDTSVLVAEYDGGDRQFHVLRTRAQEILGFEYQLEMYKPAAKRRWGYFALPVLYGNRLVGKVDAKADRKPGVLAVHAVHEDVPFTRTMTAAVAEEVDELARWLGLGVSRA